VLNPAPTCEIASAEAAEVARLAAEYRRRAERIPPDFYGWSRPASRFAFCQTLRASIAALVEAGCFPFDHLRIADIGCGSGKWLVEFVQWGADPLNLAGIDLGERQIEEARRKLPTADLRVGHAGRLPWPAESFDLATQFTLFTSVLNPAIKRSIAQEMLRILKPGGAVLWYDFAVNNPRNPNVRGIGAREIRSLFEGCTIRLRRTELAPPLARLVVPVSWMLGLLLEKIWFLRTHYVGVFRKAAA